MTEKRAAKGSGKQAAKRGRWLLLALGLWLVIGASVHASIPPLELKPSSLDRFEELLSHTPLPQASSRAWVPLASAPRYRLFEPPPPGGGFLGLRRSAEEDRAWAKSRVWAFDLGWEEQHQWAQWLRVEIAEGVFVERYEYSPFGERSILVDSTPPQLHQVRVVAGELWLEMSEEIRWEAFVSGVADGRVTLENETTSASYPLEADQPVVSGRARGRRIVLRQQGTDPWPAAGDEVRLVIVGQGLIVEGDPPRPGSPLEDLFRNQPFEDLVTTLTWPASDAVLSDTRAPLLEELCVVEGGFLEAQFSEPVDPALLGGEFLVDGGSVTWIAEVSGYLLRSVSGVAAGPHTFTIGTGALDLSGKGLEEAFSGGVEVTGTEEHFVFEAAPPGLVVGTTIGNRLGFQGLEEEVDTGLLYVRNRWYDPQMGRFISTDPLGYVDSPSLYAGFGWQPNMATDPMGSYVGSAEQVRSHQAQFEQSLPYHRAYWQRDSEQRLAYAVETVVGAHALVSNLGSEGLASDLEIRAALHGFLDTRTKYGLPTDQDHIALEMLTMGAGQGLNGTLGELQGIGVWADLSFSYLNIVGLGVTGVEGGLALMAGVQFLRQYGLQGAFGRLGLTSASVRPLIANPSGAPTVNLVSRRSLEFTHRVQIPVTRARPGFVRVFRGTYDPDLSQVSASRRGADLESAASGEIEIMSIFDAARHGRSVIPDGVSVTVDPWFARTYGSHTIVYEIPESLYRRLPVGDRLQSELVFKYFIPEEFRVRVFRNSVGGPRSK